MNILAALAADPNIDPDLRRIFYGRHDKVAPRRFLERPEQPSAFASLDAEIDALDRRDERGDRAAHERDDAAERAERGL